MLTASNVRGIPRCRLVADVDAVTTKAVKIAAIHEEITIQDFIRQGLELRLAQHRASQRAEASNGD